MRVIRHCLLGVAFIGVVISTIGIAPMSVFAGTDANFSWSFESDQAGAQAGYSTSLIGDINGDGYADVAVGVPYYDNGNTDEGAVFVFYGSSLGVSESADWTKEGGQDNAYFGYAVSGAGDVNNDGYDDLLIGAPGHDGAGSACLFWICFWTVF